MSDGTDNRLYGTSYGVEATFHGKRTEGVGSEIPDQYSNSGRLVIHQRRIEELESKYKDMDTSVLLRIEALEMIQRRHQKDIINLQGMQLEIQDLQRMVHDIESINVCDDADSKHYSDNKILEDIELILNELKEAHSVLKETFNVAFFRLQNLQDKIQGSI